MKLAGFVVVGLVVTFIVYSLVVFWILDKYLPSFAGGGCSNLRVCFLVVLPVSLLLGSILTGYLSYPIMDTKWGLVGIAPGLYVVLLFVVSPCVLSSIGPIDAATLSGGLWALLYGLFLYLASLGGVALGYFLRWLSRRCGRLEGPN